MARFCVDCGAALDEGARFCVECGTPVEQVAAAPAPNAPPAPTPQELAAPTPAGAAVAAAAAASVAPSATPTVEAMAVATAAPPVARYSGLWRRLIAYLIDAVLLTLALAFVPVPDVARYAVWLVYFVGLWTLGGTVGMRILGIRLIDKNGARPSVVVSLRRALGFVLSAIPFGLGFLWIAFDKRKQGWHDKVAGTFAARGAFVPALAVAETSGGRARPAHGTPAIVVALLVILVLLMGATAAAGYYMVAPDLPNGGPLAAAPSIDDLKSDFPALAGATGPVTRSTPDEIQQRDALLNRIPESALPPVPSVTSAPTSPASSPAASGSPRVTAAPTASVLLVTPSPNPNVPPAARAAALTAAQDRQMAAQLRSTGLPVTLVTRTPLSSGKTAMVVGLDFSKISAGPGSDGGFAASVDSFVRLARTNQLRVTGTDHVVVAVHDARGRVMFGAAAPTTAVTQFRAGQIQQRDFLRRVAIKAESRTAVVDQARKQLFPDFRFPWERRD